MKFKIGDEVIIISYTGGKHGIRVGLIGKVVNKKKSEESTEEFPVKVEFENYEEIFYEKELRLFTKLERVMK